MARASAPRMECWDTLVEPEDTMLYLADARRIDGRVEDVPVTARYIDMAGAAYEHDSFDTHVRLGLLVRRAWMHVRSRVLRNSGLPYHRRFVSCHHAAYAPAS